MEVKSGVEEKRVKSTIIRRRAKVEPLVPVVSEVSPPAEEETKKTAELSAESVKAPGVESKPSIRTQVGAQAETKVGEGGVSAIVPAEEAVVEKECIRAGQSRGIVKCPRIRYGPFIDDCRSSRMGGSLGYVDGGCLDIWLQSGLIYDGPPNTSKYH